MLLSSLSCCTGYLSLAIHCGKWKSGGILYTAIPPIEYNMCTYYFNMAVQRLAKI